MDSNLLEVEPLPQTVTPAQAGVQTFRVLSLNVWIPAIVCHREGGGRNDGIYGWDSVWVSDFNRQSLPRTITDASGTHTLTYDALGQRVSDVAAGVAPALSI